MAKVKYLENNKFVSFHCPGCDCRHMVCIEPYKNYPVWCFNGDSVSPTITPSILVNRDSINSTEPVCHSFVTDGKIQYLDDCTHGLAGQTVDLPELE